MHATKSCGPSKVAPHQRLNDVQSDAISGSMSSRCDDKLSPLRMLQILSIASGMKCLMQFCCTNLRSVCKPHGRSRPTVHQYRLGSAMPSYL
eukprot:6310923-Amphidinium_carterae.1